jgi:hypothetical protein
VCFNCMDENEASAAPIVFLIISKVFETTQG